MASTKLSRLPSTTGNRRTFTISAWVKRSSLGARQAIFAAGDTGTVGAGGGSLRFESDDKLRIVFGGGNDGTINSSRVFRDTSAWYHIVWRIDTTQATASDRAKLWVNGEEETLSFSTNISQNYDTAFNYASTNQYTHFGAARDAGSQGDANTHYLDGLMAHIHLTDGQAYSASDFGETDTTTNIWKPKTAPSVTYGTNGVFLKMENSGAFGTDSSGNGNTFTVNGTMTQTIDTPSNVFATMNPLQYSPSTEFSNGNLTLRQNAGVNAHRRFLSTLGVSQGKYYWETKCVDNPSTFMNGISDGSGGATSYANFIGELLNDVGYYGDGNVYKNGSSVASGLTTFSAGDIINIALDLDNNYIYFGVNGTWINSGVPTSGSSGTGGFSVNSGNTYFAGVSMFTNNQNSNANFGNGYFGTTAVSSAQNPDDGIGIFEYDVPANYRALCTKSINAEEYS